MKLGLFFLLLLSLLAVSFLASGWRYDSEIGTFVGPIEPVPDWMNQEAKRNSPACIESDRKLSDKIGDSNIFTEEEMVLAEECMKQVLQYFEEKDWP